MKTNYLFPNRYKKIGLSVLIPSLILGLIALVFEFEPEALDLNVFAFFVDEIFGDKKYFGWTENNILNEIFGVLIIVSAVLVAFSKENQEDEFISKIRLESLVWATYLNYGILLLAILFVFDFSFLWVMIFNMFTILLFFIIRFNWQVYKLKKAADYEE